MSPVREDRLICWSVKSLNSHIHTRGPEADGAEVRRRGAKWRMYLHTCATGLRAAVAHPTEMKLQRVPASLIGGTPIGARAAALHDQMSRAGVAEGASMAALEKAASMAVVAGIALVAVDDPTAEEASASKSAEEVAGASRAAKGELMVEAAAVSKAAVAVVASTSEVRVAVVASTSAVGVAVEAPRAVPRARRLASAPSDARCRPRCTRARTWTAACASTRMAWCTSSRTGACAISRMRVASTLSPLALRRCRCCAACSPPTCASTSSAESASRRPATWRPRSGTARRSMWTNPP